MSRDSAGMNQNSAKFTDSAKLMNSTTYSLNISGGKTYVKAAGDGLDSNGPITITGGEVEVWGQASSGNNDALDCDGTLTINGGTVFASGGIGVDGVPSPSGGQTGLYYPSTISAGSGRGGMGGTSSIASGTLFTVSNGSQTVYQTRSDQTGAYAFYTSPTITSSYSISASTSGSVNCLYANSWAHSWNDGEITTAATETESGVMTYTCTVCGETETRTIPATGSSDNGGGSETGGNTVTVDGTSAAINVDFSNQEISAGAYTLIAAFYNEDGKMLYANVISPITLDSTLSAFVSGLLCPEAFDNCEAFLLDGNTCPACEAVSLSVVTE